MTVPTRTLTVAGVAHRYYSASDTLGPDYRRWPTVLRLLAENIARRAPEPDRSSMLSAVRGWIHQRTSDAEIHYSPSRLLMHDTTSTPALVDMAAMRDALALSGVDPTSINPLLPVEISVDHSLAVEHYGTADAPGKNIRTEIRRNRERYRFLKWASSALDNIHINPPGTGIMHTINLEQLATVVTSGQVEGEPWVYPDMMLGTDSHTPMINGLGVLGWGIGGLEAESVMFGFPTTLKIPDVVGVKLTGALRPGVLSTDLALVVTNELRRLGVAGAFVEFFGPGVASLSVGDRAVVANMAPEYGATTGYFPADEAVIDYLRLTGRPASAQQLVRDYLQPAGLWFEPENCPEYSREILIDLSAIRTSVAGPRRPQDLLSIEQVPQALRSESFPAERDPDLPEFPIALASITSCTNTSDARLLIAAGLLARTARRRGLRPPEWVKTSLAPGSPAAVSFLERAGLLDDLAAVGFDIVGFGCATCIGNSGPLPEMIARSLRAGTSQPVAVLSGNRNFPGRVHPDLELGLLMSPPMVIAYALTGDAATNVSSDPLGTDREGRPVYVRDLWPSSEEIDHVLSEAIDPDDYLRDFRTASDSRLWQEIEAPTGDLFPWDEDSTMLRPPPFAREASGSLLGTYLAHPLMVLGSDVTTDHISPASAIPRDSFIADFLVARGEDRDDLNVFASRRGNWEVMARGAFHAKSLRNSLAPGAGTATTVHGPSGQVMSVWEAAQRYQQEGIPVVVIAGERYGMGSSRDWAAKVQHLLGVRAVLATSFERIHRSNLIGMGIVPLTVSSDIRLRLDGLSPGDRLEIQAEHVAPRSPINVSVHSESGNWSFSTTAAIETDMEVQLLRAGGVIPTILDSAIASRRPESHPPA